MAFSRNLFEFTSSKNAFSKTVHAYCNSYSWMEDSAQFFLFKVCHWKKSLPPEKHISSACCLPGCWNCNSLPPNLYCTNLLITEDNWLRMKWILLGSWLSFERLVKILFIYLFWLLPSEYKRLSYYVHWYSNKIMFETTGHDGRGVLGESCLDGNNETWKQAVPSLLMLIFNPSWPFIYIIHIFKYI